MEIPLPPFWGKGIIGSFFFFLTKTKNIKALLIACESILFQYQLLNDLLK